MSDCPKPQREMGALDPEYRERFQRYFQALEATFSQFNFIVTETRRTQERQDCLRQAGASKVRRSNHQDGQAVDFAIYRHSTGELDWRPQVYRNVYRVLDPRKYGLTSGAHLWGWDQGHLQVVEVQGEGNDLDPEMEAYTV